MEKQLLALSVLIAFPVWAGTWVSPGTVITRPVDKVEVKGELVASKIREIPLIKEATVFEPKFVFSEDFGYGTEILPALKITSETQFSYITQYVCQQFGYGAAKRTEKSRPNPSKYVMHFSGDPAAADSKGLNIGTGTTDQTSLPANLVCSLK